MGEAAPLDLELLPLARLRVEGAELLELVLEAPPRGEGSPLAREGLVEQAQGELSSALSRLLVTVEQYPELKANANYLALQDELAGTENRIGNERRRFTETVQTYNTAVKSFPMNMLAGMFGFQPKAYFEAKEGAEEAPKVNF